jgi:hypothetical protein
MDLEVAERWVVYVEGPFLHPTIGTVRLRLHCFNIKFADNFLMVEYWLSCWKIGCLGVMVSMQWPSYTIAKFNTTSSLSRQRFKPAKYL